MLEDADGGFGLVLTELPCPFEENAGGGVFLRGALTVEVHAAELEQGRAHVAVGCLVIVLERSRVVFLAIVLVAQEQSGQG